MGSQYQHIKEFVDFLGIDLRSSNVVRGQGFASDRTRNVVHSTNGGLTDRYGSKVIGSGGLAPFGQLGVTRFDTVDLLGNAKTEIIGFGADSQANSCVPYRLVNSTFPIYDNHTSQDATVSMFYVPGSSQFVFTGVVGSTTEVTKNLGLGTEGSPVTLADLCTAINASTHLTATAPSNAASVPAAFIELLPASFISHGGNNLNVNFWYWQKINAPNGTSDLYATLKNVMLEFGATSFRNVSAATLGGVLYIAPGLHSAQTYSLGTTLTTAKLCKYDGQNFFRAGLPYPGRDGSFSYDPTALTSPQTVTDDVKGNRTITSTATIGTVIYLLTYIHIDKTGQRVETSSSPYTGTAFALANTPISQVLIQDSNALIGKGFCNNYAVCSSGATSLTVTCGAHQTLQAGDVAYFWDAAQSRFIQRVVASVTNTTITLSSQAIDNDPNSPTYDAGTTPHVLTNALITNNMRIGIYRTVNAGTSVFYLLEEVPNWNVAAAIEFSYKYYDTFDDTAINNSARHPVWIEPQYPRDLPPATRYVTTFNSQLILLGDELNPQRIYFSDIDGQEYVPSSTHNFDLPVPAIAAGQSGEILACFGDTRAFVVAGDLAGFNFAVNRIADQIGCVSQASLQQIDEGVLAFLSRKGPYLMYYGRQVVPMGAKSYPDGSKVSRIEPFFTQRYLYYQTQPVLERAVSAMLSQDRMYVLFVPLETPGQWGFSTTQSVCWVYDWGRDAWWKWDGLNMAAGALEVGGQLYFSGRASNGNATDWTGIFATNSQQQRDKGAYNYADHNAATNFEWRSHWESLGEPAMFKRFLRCRISNYEGALPVATTLGLNTYVNYDDTAQSNADTLTFATTTKDLKPKLKAEIVRSMQFAFAKSTFYSPVVITGFELEAVADFRQEMKE